MPSPDPSFGPSRAGVAAAKIAARAAQAAPGSRLGTKEEVRSAVDVSLGTFNESLRLLQTRGLVTVRPGPGGGLFVAEPSPMARLGNALLSLNLDRSTVAETLRIRDALEFLVVEDACRYASPQDLDAMHGALERMADALRDEDGVGFLHANWELHSKIAAATGTEILASIYTSLLDLIEEHTVSVRAAGPMSLTDFHAERLAIHEELVEAIEQGNVPWAKAIVREHNAGLSSDTTRSGRPRTDVAEVRPRQRRGRSADRQPRSDPA